MSAQPTSSRPAINIPCPATLRSLVIEWGISRRAMGDRAPAGTSLLLTLRYSAELDQPEHWTLLDPVSKAETPLPDELTRLLSIPTVRVSGDRVHVHSPMLYAFVGIDDHDSPTLMYARTRVFELLQLGGGRYQPMGVRVRFE